MGCEHGNSIIFSGRCPCSPACFCQTLGVCRDSQEEPSSARAPTPPRTPTPGLRLEANRVTDKMEPFVVTKRLEIDLDNPVGVAEFLEAVANSIRRRGRIVLIVE